MDSRLKQHCLGFWEVITKPTAQELNEYYANKYYQQALGSYEHEYTEDELNYFDAKLEQRYQIVVDNLISVESRLSFLDVGCGEGYALNFFKKHKWEVKGFDFSSAGIASKNPGCLNDLVVGDVFQLLDDEIKAGKQYDVIWLQNVLEHVLDPVALMRSLRGLVKRNGMTVITVPNDCSITQMTALERGHIDTAFWVVPPDHLNYFDSVSLNALSEFTGWEKLEIISDFPVDWFIFNKHSNYVRVKSLGKAAHFARIEIENLINTQENKLINNFYSAMAKLGLGRGLTIFLHPSK